MSQELLELEAALIAECERHSLPTNLPPARMFELLLIHLEGNHAAVVEALQWRVRKVQEVGRQAQA